MKKRVFAPLMALCLAVSLVLPAFAVTEPAADDTSVAVTQQEGTSPYVRDEAGLLDAASVQALETQAETLSAQYQCGVYILTVADFTADGSDTIRNFSKDYYLDNDLGWGEGKDGELLVLSMAERDYWLLAYGDHGNATFTDRNKTELEDVFLDNFREDDWFGGFQDYLTTSERMLAEEAADSQTETGPNWELLGIAVLGSCIIALIVCLIFKAQMKTARMKRDASDYIDSGAIHFSIREDRFTHRTESRVLIERDHDHGGTSIDSDGFSGSGGKF